MFDVLKVERQIGEHTLTIETGKIARQAHGAVTVQYGDTVVLVAATTAAPRNEEIDFFPLSVDYREKQSAAGKFPGGFIKREGRPSTKEILTARMIDRPIRPLFPDGYFQEVQIMATVLSFDGENDPDILCMIGASAALSISKIPFMGPLGACRVGRVNGEMVVNPTHSQLAESDMNVLVAGKQEELNMIEVAAKQLPESVIAEGCQTAHDGVKQICEMIDELAGKKPVEKEAPVEAIDSQIMDELTGQLTDKLYDMKQIADKQQRDEAVSGLFEQCREQYCQSDDPAVEPRCTKRVMNRMLDAIEENVVRKLLLEGKRIDGRGFDDVRPIDCQVGILPRTHGSAIFTRGQTQALVSVTLGTIRDAQIIDGLLEEYSQRFTLHYNFPPYSVGEVRPIRGPGRREIGHGALAEKALDQVKPSDEEFAYTIRIVSDITESNGSSSMATVCGGTLALMDAGVPIDKPVAGISIGLITDKQNGDYKLLTDIIGEEDHFGEMDFKVAGTTEGITAIQLDIKREGLAMDVMAAAMEKAKQARLKILETMTQTISAPREQLSTYAPKLIAVEIDPEFIGRVIGPGGKMIKSIQEQTNTTIEIEEDGTVFISCVGGDGHFEAKEIIESMTQPPEVGKLYPKSKVVSVKDFGVFVEFAPGVEGLCHISELSGGYVKSVDEVCKMGDIIPVKLINIDEQGRFKLSRKAAMKELGLKDETEDKPKKDKGKR